MPPVLTERSRTSERNRSASSQSLPNKKNRSAADALKSLEEHILKDGFRIVFDLYKSRVS
jgi:hypothetical protein